MNKLLWIIQVLLAGAFLLAGFGKATMPADQLIEQMPFVTDTGVFAARVAGIAEVLGAIGLIAPSALRVLPRLTAAAAAGLVLVMLGAIVVHTGRGEFSAVAVNAVLGSLAAFVAWGRMFGAPIAPASPLQHAPE